MTATPRRYPTVEAHLTLGVLAKLGLFLVATVMLIAAIGRAQQLIGLVILAGVLSATVAPLIDRVRSTSGAVAAAVIVHAIVFASVVGTTAMIVQQIRVEAEHLETYTTAQLAQLDDDVTPLVFSRADLSRRASEATASWGTTAVVGDDEATGIAMRASQLVVITVLSIFFSLQGDRIIDAVARSTDDRQRRRVARAMWSDSVAAGSKQLRHTLLHGAIVGVTTVAVALVFGLPGVALLAFWSACASAVPVVGPFVGWTPVVVVGALTLDPEPLTVLVTIIAVSVLVLGRTRARSAPKFTVGPLLITLGVAAGLNAAGLPGAAAGLFIATGLAHAAANHRWASRLDEHDPSLGDASDDTAGAVEVDRSTDPPNTRSTGVYVDLSSETLLRIGGLVVLAVMVQLSLARIGTILIWAIVGLLIAVGIDRPVSWLEERTSTRRSVIVIAGASMVLALLLAVGVASRSGASSVTEIDDDLPGFAAALEELPMVGDRLAGLDIDQTIEDLRRQVPSALDRSPLAGRAVRIVGGGAVALFWIVATTIAALIDGPRVVGAVGRRVPARYTRQVNRLAGAARSALAGYVAGSALVAGINALLVGSLATVAGVPTPVIFAMWAFSWNFVPQIGAILGWAPMLLLALVLNPLTGLAILVFFVGYQVVENNVVQPTIVGHAVDISALGALGAALAGTAVAGLVGAVLAIPVVGVVNALRSEVRSADFPRL